MAIVLALPLVPVSSPQIRGECRTYHGDALLIGAKEPDGGGDARILLRAAFWGRAGGPCEHHRLLPGGGAANLAEPGNPTRFSIMGHRAAYAALADLVARGRRAGARPIFVYDKLRVLPVTRLLAANLDSS